MKSLSKGAVLTTAGAILLGSTLALSNAHAAFAATQFQPDKTAVSMGAGIFTGLVQATGDYARARTATLGAAEAGPSVAPQRYVTYTFATPSGSPYCNGVSLEQVGYEALGYALYSSCGSYNVNAGGFASKIHGLDKDTVWAITTTDPEASGYTYVYLLDERARYWEVWGESYAGSFTFSLINAGELLIGYSSDRRGGVPATQGRQ